MEKTAPALSLQTNAADEELRQLQWRGRQITRVLMALRLTARILAFALSFVPGFRFADCVESLLRGSQQRPFINIIRLKIKPITVKLRGQRTQPSGRNTLL